MTQRKDRVVHFVAFIALVASLFAPIATLPVIAEDLEGDTQQTDSINNVGQSGSDVMPGDDDVSNDPKADDGVDPGAGDGKPGDDPKADDGIDPGAGDGKPGDDPNADDGIDPGAGDDNAGDNPIVDDGIDPGAGEYDAGDDPANGDGIDSGIGDDNPGDNPNVDDGIDSGIGDDNPGDDPADGDGGNPVGSGPTIVQTVNKTEAHQGEALTYQVHTINNSPESQALGFVLSLSSGVTYLNATIQVYELAKPNDLAPATGFVCSHEGGVVTCESNGQNIQAQNAYLVTIEVAVNESAVCDTVLESTVSGLHFNAGSTASATTNVWCEPEFSISNDNGTGTIINTVDKPEAYPGDTLTYQIHAINDSNQGQSMAIWNILPAGVHYMDMSIIYYNPDVPNTHYQDSYFQCQHIIGQFRCENREFSRLSNGLAYLVTFTAFIHPSVACGTVLENEVRGNHYNKGSSDTATTTVVCPELSIEKTDNDGGPPGKTLEPGQSFTYTATVSNNSAVDSSGYSFIENIPAGITITDFNGANCSPGATPLTGPATVSCSGSALGSNSHHTYTFGAQVTNEPTAEMCQNGVINQVEGDDGDWSSENQTSSVTTFIDCQPAIEVTKTDNLAGEDATPGQPFNYSIAVENTGNIPLANVVVDDLLPDALVANAWIETGGMTCDLATLSCSTAEVGVGQSQSVVLEVEFVTDLTSEECSGISNEVSASANSAGGNVQDTDTQDTTPDCVVDYSFSKIATDGVDLVGPGGTISFTVVLVNDGTIDLTSAEIVESLPTLPTAAEWTLSPGSGLACDVATIAGGPVDCYLTENLQPGDEVSLTITAEVPATLQRPAPDNPSWCQPWTTSVTGTFTWSNNEQRMPEQAAQAGVDIDCQPAIQVTKTDNLAGEEATPGQPFNYSIAVENTGNILLENVVVDDLLPDALIANAWTETDGMTCDLATLSCSTAEVGVGQSQTVVLEVQFVTDLTSEECSGIANEVAASASSAGGNVQDTDTQDTTPDCEVDYAFSKIATDGVDLVGPGGTISFTVVLVNDGTIDLTSAEIVESLPTLPTPAEWTLSPGSGLACDVATIAGGPVDCYLTEKLQPGDGVELIITTDVPDVLPLPEPNNPAWCQPWTNEVSGTFTWSNGEQRTPEDGSEAIVDIDCQQDFTVQKISETETSSIALGDTITYSVVVTNTGNQPLGGITLTDTFSGEGELLWQDGFDPERPLPEIAVGQNLEVSATYIVTQGDIDAGIIEKCVFLVYQTGGTASLDRESCVEDIVTQNPAVQMVKTSTVNNEQEASVFNTVIIYTFTITNTGNVTLSDLEVTDDTEGIVFTNGISTVDSLAPGASADLTATYEVTQNDVNSGMIVNCADIAALDPGGVPLAAEGCDTRMVDQVFAIDLLPAAECPSPPEVYDEITLQISVTNTGTVSLHNVVVKASTTGEFDETFPTAFSPNQTETRGWTMTITEDHLAAGGISVEFTVSGDGPIDATSFVASVVAMKASGDSATGSFVFSCPMDEKPALDPNPNPNPDPGSEPDPRSGSEPEPETDPGFESVPVITKLPETGAGDITSEAAMLRAALTLGLFALGSILSGKNVGCSRSL